MDTKRKIIFALLGLVLMGGAFGFGVLFGQDLGKTQCPVCPPEELDFSLFWEAYHKLQENFVNGDKIDTKTIIYGAISGMVKALGDPYTVFFPPEDAKVFEQDVRGVFEGVGMEIGIRKGQLQVIAPLEGTPAQKAGLRPGDKILKINDVETADLTIEEAVRLIRGPKGTKVLLTIFREEEDAAREIEIERAVIEIPSLKLEFKEGNIAYLKLYHFSEQAASDFRASAVEILNSPAQKIILDLRNNPGGYLEVAQEIGGWFLERGQVVAIEDFGKGERKEFKSEGPGRLSTYPLLVLINEGSASAAEILAGALRDNRAVTLIGEKSFGTGSIQGLEKLRDDSSLKITIARWLTPKGNTLSEVGLEPDIKVELTDEDYEKGLDPQLDKALEVIKEMR
jgi:carboxyl-terminal processing protease